MDMIPGRAARDLSRLPAPNGSNLQPFRALAPS